MQTVDKTQRSAKRAAKQAFPAIHFFNDTKITEQEQKKIIAGPITAVRDIVEQSRKTLKTAR